MLVSNEGHIKLTDFGLSKVKLDRGLLMFLLQCLWRLNILNTCLINLHLVLFRIESYRYSDHPIFGQTKKRLFPNTRSSPVLDKFPWPCEYFFRFYMGLFDQKLQLFYFSMKNTPVVDGKRHSSASAVSSPVACGKLEKQQRKSSYCSPWLARRKELMQSPICPSRTTGMYILPQMLYYLSFGWDGQILSLITNHDNVALIIDFQTNPKLTHPSSIYNANATFIASSKPLNLNIYSLAIMPYSSGP